MGTCCAGCYDYAFFHPLRERKYHETFCFFQRSACTQRILFQLLWLSKEVIGILNVETVEVKREATNHVGVPLQCLTCYQRQTCRVKGRKMT
jgi:hypothetical protein